MPKIIIEVDLDNSAFEDNPHELTQILRDQVCSRIAAQRAAQAWRRPMTEEESAGLREISLKPGDEAGLKYSNGNTVGSFRVVP